MTLSDMDENGRTENLDAAKEEVVVRDHADGERSHRTTHEKQRSATKPFEKFRKKWTDEVSFDRKLEHVLSLSIFVAASAAAIFAFWQLAEIRATTEMARSEHRAFLQFTHIVADAPRVNEPFLATLYFVNSGKSPALRFDPRGTVASCDGPPPERRNGYPKLPIPSITDLGPAQETNIFLKTVPIDAVSMKKIEDGTESQCVFGVVYYGDSLGCRVLYYCDQLEASGRWLRCETHNRTEDIPCDQVDE